MVTVVGNGMGDYDFSNISLDLTKFDKIICDKNFKEEGENILKFSFKEAKEYLIENSDKENLLYVVTGSPLFYSGGTLIAKYIKDVKIIDNTSSKSHMLSSLAIAENNCLDVSLHGRVDVDLNLFLQKDYTFVLCDEKSIDRLKYLLNFVQDKIEVYLGSKLGYVDESIEKVDLFNDEFDTKKLMPFSIVIKRLYKHQKNVCDDVEFETERGMITKKFKRHMSLQNLDLEANMLLLDIGAGSGSCGIEAYKRYRVKTIFFEKNETRCEFILNNLKNHNVLDTRLIIGDAEEEFTKEEISSLKPERIFVGGGGEKVIKKLDFLYEILAQNGIMLINAITLKHLNQIMSKFEEENIEYQVHSISLTTYKGKLDLVEPERQLFQLKVYKK